MHNTIKYADGSLSFFLGSLLGRSANVAAKAERGVSEYIRRQGGISGLTSAAYKYGVKAPAKGIYHAGNALEAGINDFAGGVSSGYSSIPGAPKLSTGVVLPVVGTAGLGYGVYSLAKPNHMSKARFDPSKFDAADIPVRLYPDYGLSVKESAFKMPQFANRYIMQFLNNMTNTLNDIRANGSVAINRHLWGRGEHAGEVAFNMGNSIRNSTLKFLNRNNLTNTVY